MEIDNTDNRPRPAPPPRQQNRRPESGQRQPTAPVFKETPQFQKVLEQVTQKSGLLNYASSQTQKKGVMLVRDPLADSESGHHELPDENSDLQETKDDPSKKKTRKASDNDKRTDKKSEAGEGLHTSGPTHKRVTSKSDLHQGQGGAGSGSHEGGGQGGKGSSSGHQGDEKHGHVPSLKKISSHRPVMLVPQSVQKAELGGQPPPVTNVPTGISKAVLDQMIQQVALVVRGKNDKEIQLELNDRFFKGLRLRVHSKNGRVQVTFLTPTLPMRRLLEAHKEEVVRGLENKGIDVEGVNVTLS